MIYKTKPENLESNFNVVSCFVEYEGKILLLHRLPTKSQPNKWGNPAGKVSENEKFVEAMIRELYEETKIACLEKDLNFISTTFVSFPDMNFYYHIYKLKLVSRPEVEINPLEHQDFIWIEPENALKMDLVTDQDYYVKEVYLN